MDDVVSIIVGDAQEDRRIVTVAVPKQAEVATEDTSQEIANIKNKEEELTKEVNKELLSEWVHAANKVVLSDIFLALYGKGVFTDFLFLFPASVGGYVITAFLLSKFVPDIKPDFDISKEKVPKITAQLYLSIQMWKMWKR